MVRRATGQQLDEALSSLASLFEGESEGVDEAPELAPPAPEPQQKRELDA
jgi:hypothetical protein